MQRGVEDRIVEKYMDIIVLDVITAIPKWNTVKQPKSGIFNQYVIRFKSKDKVVSTHDSNAHGVEILCQC